MPNATIYDVAEQARVSIATVSRVLNAPTQVNRQTRARVIEAIDLLGFVPKADAAARARQGTGRIGILTPFYTFSSFVHRLHGIATVLADSSYELVVYYVDSTARRDGYLLTLPITRRLDGLIVMALPFDEATARRLLVHQLPTVLIEAPHPSFNSVEIDDSFGGHLAAEYFIAKGFRRCAFVGDSDVPDYAIRTSDWRLDGYRKTLASAGIPMPDHYIALAPHSMEHARQQARRLFELPEPPDAIFAASDTQALGVLKAARECGIAVPSQLAVIGFDDIDIADYVGLTTVSQSLDESGRVAVDLLMAHMADYERSVRHVRLPLKLINRETT